MSAMLPLPERTTEDCAASHGITNKHVISYLDIARQNMVGLGLHPAVVAEIERQIIVGGVLADPKVGVCLIELCGKHGRNSFDVAHQVADLYRGDIFIGACNARISGLANGVSIAPDEATKVFVGNIASAMAETAEKTRKMPLTFEQCCLLARIKETEYTAFRLMAIGASNDKVFREQVVPFAESQFQDLDISPQGKRQYAANLLLQVARLEDEPQQSDIVRSVGELLLIDPGSNVRWRIGGALKKELKHYERQRIYGVATTIASFITALAKQRTDPANRDAQMAIPDFLEKRIKDYPNCPYLTEADAMELLVHMHGNLDRDVSRAAGKVLTRLDEVHRTAEVSKRVRNTVDQWKLSLKVA